MGNTKKELTQEEINAKLDEVRELEVKAENVTYTDDKGKEKTFLGFKFLNKDGRYENLSFRKEVDNMPKEEGVYKLRVKAKNTSYDKNRKYPRLWVHEVEDFELAYNYVGNPDDLPF